MSEPERSNIIPILFQQVPPRLSHVCHQGAVTINYFPEGHPSRPSSFFKFPNIGQGYNSHEPVWHTPWANVDDMQRECAQVHQYHARARARTHTHTHTHMHTTRTHAHASGIFAGVIRRNRDETSVFRTETDGLGWQARAGVRSLSFCVFVFVSLFLSLSLCFCSFSFFLHSLPPATLYTCKGCTRM